MAEETGIVGLGNAGLAVASALLVHGPVVGFDRSEERRQLAMDAGITVVETLQGLEGRAPVILLSLPKPEASLAVAGDLAGWSGPPELVIETSTVTPDTAQKSAALLDAAGIGYVDAAIAGGVASMAAGEITFFLGGSDANKAAARPVLERVASRIFDLGSVGAGMGTKVVNNGVMHAVMVVLIEAFAMARKLDIPTDTLVEILNREEGLLRPLIHRVGERMQDGKYAAGMSVSNARKDSVLALETAQQLGVPIFATLAAHTPYEIAEAKGMGNQDYAALAKLWEDWCDVGFRR
ncbi:NAD(P)-dependent oxidoreductase [Nisaea sp.]|uniref:NAD(P)-dependent oxidoreductase n=1 Tax=Nisaea sp. TaxID=2024842 RepID=UPI0032EBF75A